MKIIKVINNNVLSAFDENGQEVVLMGRGLGFKAKTGDDIDESRVQDVYKRQVYSRSMGIISITAIIAIWSAAKGVQYMTDGLNSVNDLEETRNWFVLRFWAVVYTVVFLVAIVFTLLVLVFGNQLKVLATQYVPILESCV